MSDYIGGGLALAAIVALILGVMFFSGSSGTGEVSILPEAMAAAPGGPDYGWKTPMSEQADERPFSEFY